MPTARGYTQSVVGKYQILTVNKAVLDRRSAIQRESLAFVTIWALFGIELIGRDAKDVVALDADAVNEDL
jgi:hypothetical protein